MADTIRIESTLTGADYGRLRKLAEYWGETHRAIIRAAVKALLDKEGINR